MAKASSAKKREDVSRHLKLLPYSKVREKIIDALSGRNPGIERVPIDAALGRVSAETVGMSYDLPAITSSAMDGYAIRSVETGNAHASRPVLFDVKGSLYPSSRRPASRLRGFDSYYVGTGAPVPIGADAVVKVEETRLVGSKISVSLPVPKWKNIAPQGKDLRAGAKVVAKGHIVNAADIALLISAGRSDLAVIKSPRVGILSTGDELTVLGSEEEGKKVNNFSNLIAGYLADAGTVPVPLGVAKDDEGEIREIVERELRHLDALVTIGGCSVGVKDLTPNALQGASECQEVFHGIRLVPVRPTGLFMVGKKPVVLLPGQSVAAALSFFLVVRPIVNILSGLGFDSRLPVIKARLSEGFSNHRPIGALFLVRLTAEDGLYTATPLAWGSNLISSLASANGYLQLDPGQTLKVAETVTVTLLGAQEILRVSRDGPH